MAKKITDTVFQESIKYYYQVLKKGYLNEIENASDLEYAKKHFQTVFFLENECVPYESVLFQELRFTFHHFSCLNTQTAFQKTFELLPEIRKVARKKFNDAVNYHNGDKSIFLADWYIEQLETGKVRLEELLQKEELVLKSTDENLAGALAIHLAGQQLHKEFLEIQEDNPTSSTKHSFQFTRNEQLLAIYFLIQSFGINLRQTSDRTKAAALFHLIMGVPFESMDKLKNLSIYKGLSVVPQVVSNDRQLLKYLEKIRPFFDEANFMDAVQLIDKQIQICQNELK